MYQGSLSDDVEECVNMLRAASEEFPNEPQILLKLAQALHMWGWNKYGAKGHPSDSSGIIEDDIEYNSQNIYWQEAVRAYEKILKSNPSSEEREITIRQITPLYCRMGEYEKAKALANDQNSIVISKEVLLPLATVGEEKARYQGERIMALLSNLRFAISEAVATRPAISTSEYGRQILLSVIKLYETVFNDGRCGRWHWDIGHLYLTLAHYELDNDGSMEKVFNYFDKGFDHCKEYIPAAPTIEDCAMYPYVIPLLNAFSSWSKKNYGELSVCLKNMFLYESSEKKRAGECRKAFHNKEFQSFELKEIEERSCCLTRISVQVNWKVGEQLHSETLEFGSMYQDETDKFAYPWKNNGTWILYPWDIRGLNA